MLKKIAFLCVTPMEGFLSSAFQSNVREYYQWMYDKIRLKSVDFYCRERIEAYGEAGVRNAEELFLPEEDITQLLYIQSNRKELLKEVFEKSDLVVMGLSGCRREFDKIFMPVFPWKDQVLFFWDQQICRDAGYIRQICNEYKLREAQLIKLERNAYGKLKM